MVVTARKVRDGRECRRVLSVCFRMPIIFYFSVPGGYVPYQCIHVFIYGVRRGLHVPPAGVSDRGQEEKEEEQEEEEEEAQIQGDE